jgi:hypothetical protein
MISGYPNVSQVFDVDPQTAAEAFDVMILDPAIAADLIPAGPLVRARPTRYDAWRRLPATLRQAGGRGRGVGVVLELLPWSNTRSELAIHTAQRPGLMAERSVQAYLRAATRSLDTLAELLGTARDLADPLIDGWEARLPTEFGHRGRALPEPRRVTKLIN